MAVGKEAPVPDICITSATCRQALEAAVIEFQETIKEVTPAQIRRRIKKSKALAAASETASIKFNR